MTREEARDEIKNLLDYITGEKELNPIKTREDAEAEERKGVEALKMAIKALEQEPNWIPVGERLPKESLNSVIGWDACRERCVFVQYINGHFQITGKNESFNIKAWMPLPEPYKAESDSGQQN